MNVLNADVMGMCFGVRDALKAIDRIADPQAVTIHGELVHNEAVLIQLETRGFRTVSERNRQAIPATPMVLITAHGISDRERTRLQASGKQLVDTTCPLVVRVHRAAQMLQAEGYHVLVIGKRGHVEVQGIIEDLNSFDVIQNVEDVRCYSHSRLGIVCQSTSTTHHVQALREAVRQHNPQAEIRFIDTVCQPTKDHQKALEQLLDQVDAMIVVGGRNSNNTRELVTRCLEKGVPAYHVQSAADLQSSWFAGCGTVGLTAGTSTLDTTIVEVRKALLQL